MKRFSMYALLSSGNMTRSFGSQVLMQDNHSISSACLYGSENWVLSEKDKNRIQAAKMRFLRATLGVTRQDRLTNEAIRKTLKVDNLNDTISKYTDNWFNHLTHMNHSCFPCYMLSYKPTEKRSLGRPRRRWMSQI
jgi:hypothetical protein